MIEGMPVLLVTLVRGLAPAESFLFDKELVLPNRTLIVMLPDRC